MQLARLVITLEGIEEEVKGAAYNDMLCHLFTLALPPHDGSILDTIGKFRVPWTDATHGLDLIGSYI